MSWIVGVRVGVKVRVRALGLGLALPLTLRYGVEVFDVVFLNQRRTPAIT